MPSNPLRTFSRDEVVAKINAKNSPFRRYYFKTANGTWIQVSQAYVLRYFETTAVALAYLYELDARQESHGWGLDITPTLELAYSSTPTKDDVQGQKYEQAAIGAQATDLADGAGI